MTLQNTDEEMNELHWRMDMLQSIDIGIVVIDREYRIKVWNSFMENHSGKTSTYMTGKNLFDIFPEISEDRFMRKIETVLLLNNRGFSTWEQQSYLFNFKNYRPITGNADFMYQNITFTPLNSTDGEIGHICITIYDVTDIAVSKMGMLSANKKLESLSRTDQLTQLNNRGYWEECLTHEFLRIKRTHQNCSLLMFDIDHFKMVNDTYGHQAGDEVIRVTSRITRETIRQTDIAGRYGGEEFVVILLDTPAQQAEILAERLRKLIEACPVKHESTKINYTISLGIAEFMSDMPNYQSWIECADQALYRAKETGRNKSVVYQETRPDSKSA